MRFWRLKLHLKRIFIGDSYCHGCCNTDHYYHGDIMGLVSAYIGVSIMLQIGEEVFVAK